MSARVDPQGRGTSITQAPPRVVTKGESMHDVAARDALVYGYGRVMRLLVERKRFGFRKYGHLLRAHNGRNPMCDAAEELLDALVYLAQAREEGVPHAPELYQACMAVAGAVSRQLPDEAALPRPAEEPPAVPAPRDEHRPIGRKRT